MYLASFLSVCTVIFLTIKKTKGKKEERGKLEYQKKSLRNMDQDMFSSS